MNQNALSFHRSVLMGTEPDKPGLDRCAAVVKKEVVIALQRDIRHSDHRAHSV